jgi:hypothetical protein
VRTVIVRLFEPAPGTANVGLRGIVEDLAHGTRQPFLGVEELLAAIERAAASDELPTVLRDAEPAERTVMEP